MLEKPLPCIDMKRVTGPDEGFKSDRTGAAPLTVTGTVAVPHGVETMMFVEPIRAS